MARWKREGSTRSSPVPVDCAPTVMESPLGMPLHGAGAGGRVADFCKIILASVGRAPILVSAHERARATCRARAQHRSVAETNHTAWRSSPSKQSAKSPLGVLADRV